MQLDATTMQSVLNGFLWHLLPGVFVGIMLLEVLAIWQRRLFNRTMAALSPEEREKVRAARSRKRGFGARHSRAIGWGVSFVAFYEACGRSIFEKYLPTIARPINGLISWSVPLVTFGFMIWLLLSDVRNEFSLFDPRKVPVTLQADVETRQTLVSLRGMVIVCLLVWMLLGTWLLLPEETRVGLWK